MYTFLKILAFIVVHIFFRDVSFVGDPPDEEGSLLVCSNHVSNWDPIGMMVLFKRHLRFVGKEELSQTFFVRLFVNHMGVVFVKRDGDDRLALREMLQALREDGDYLTIFPMGTRTKKVDPKMMKDGVGFLAQRGGADVQCYYVESDYKFRGYFHLVKRPLISQEEIQELKGPFARYACSQKIFNQIYGTDFPLEDFIPEEKKERFQKRKARKKARQGRAGQADQEQSKQRGEEGQDTRSGHKEEGGEG